MRHYTIKKKDSQVLHYSYDYQLVLITAFLVIIGTIMIFSSSVIMAEARWRLPYIFIAKHIIMVLIGTMAMILLSQYDYHNLQKIALPLMIISAILLIIVLVAGTAKAGAKRWLQFGILSFQPSELAKLSMVVAICDYLDRKKSRLRYLKGLWPGILIIGIFCVLIALEPDLGTPVMMIVVGLSLMFTAGARLGHILLISMSALPFVIFEILRKPYRIERIKAYLVSLGDINAVSYQLNQSILALGSGGFFGKGLAQSKMKLLYLPEPHTDFIFPIIGEELGFIGAIAVIGLFVWLALRCWHISRSSQDLFGGLLAIGISWLIIFQALINIGVACGFFPTKGLPLPFVSFGGTALLFNMAEIGILLNISRRRIN